jgi:hypothetical protein
VIESVNKHSSPQQIRLRVIGINTDPNPNPNPSPNPVIVTPDPTPSPIAQPTFDNMCLCKLCEFEFCIGSNNSQSANATNAMQILRDPAFVSLVMNKTKNHFSTRVPYFYPESGPRQMVRLEDSHKRRPWLYLACRHNMPEVARLLLELGANPLDIIDLGSTALHVAAFRGHQECVRALLDGTPSTTRKTLVRMKNNMSGGATAADEARDGVIRDMIREHM